MLVEHTDIKARIWRRYLQHIHHAEIKDIDGFLYINIGNFVESCTDIVEHTNGRLELIKWRKTQTVLADNEALEVNLHQ